MSGHGERTEGGPLATHAGYREAANWLVGLATAALGGSFALLDKIQPSIGFKRGMALGGAGLVVTIASGILFYFWLLKLDNLIEVGRDLEKDAKANPADKDKQAKLTANAKERQDAKGSMRATYTIMIFSFFFGMLLPVGLGVTLLFGPTKSADDALRIQVVPDSTRLSLGPGRAWVVRVSGLDRADQVRVEMPADTVALPHVTVVPSRKRR